MLNQEKVVKKIQKLLALSKSPNEHEAALALAKAQELLDRENLSLSEVEGVSTSDIESFLMDSKSRFPYWDQLLFTKLAFVSDCHPYSESRQGKIFLWVVGYKKDVEVFGYFLGFLRRAISILSDKAILSERRVAGAWDRRKAFKFRNSFGVGAATRVCERVDQIRQMRLSQDVVCKALVVSRKQGVDAWVSSNLDLRLCSKKTNLSQRGFDRGYVAGGSIPLHKSVTGSNKLRLR